MSRISTRISAEYGGGAKVWGEITKLALGSNIVADLGQGYPDFEGSKTARDAASNCLLNMKRENQYSLVPGLPALRQNLSSYYAKAYPNTKILSPETEIVVTASGTEALYAAFQGIVNPGDEVVVFEPYFPWYLPGIRLAGGIPKIVTLKSPDFKISDEDCRKVFNSKTKAVVFNTPHNPTGHVASMEELETIARLCKEFDSLVISDEVYDNFAFGKNIHRRISDLPGMFDRCITIGSAAKMFSLTGWRVGWASGPEDLITAIRTVHAHSSYCAPTPLQLGIATALENFSEEEANSLCTKFQENAMLLSEGIKSVGANPLKPEGGYFLIADVSGTGKTDTEFMRWLAETKGVICVPLSVFYASSNAPKSLVRFAICKEKETIERAVNAIKA